REALYARRWTARRSSRRTAPDGPSGPTAITQHAKTRRTPEMGAFCQPSGTIAVIVPAMRRVSTPLEPDPAKIRGAPAGGVLGQGAARVDGRSDRGTVPLPAQNQSATSYRPGYRPSVPEGRGLRGTATRAGVVPVWCRFSRANASTP